MTDYARCGDFIMYLNSRYLDVRYYVIEKKNVDYSISRSIDDLPGVHIYTMYPIVWSNDNRPFLTRQSAINNLVDISINGNACILFLVVDSA